MKVFKFLREMTNMNVLSQYGGVIIYEQRRLERLCSLTKADETDGEAAGFILLCSSSWSPHTKI